ncbi:hypothetical protein CLU79DRAFT_837616 [Phycomyces nitens]|nr:hypothetical protein CLU79DRAFT_837616 [Phycomyces nitens]
MLLILAILCLLCPSTLGQESTGCMSLQYSTACPAFSQFYVGIPGLAERYSFMTNVTDVKSFDESLLTYVYSTADYLSPLGCTNKAYTTNIPYARFSMTRVCTELIQDSDYSLPCNYKNNQAPPPLCQSTCNDYMDSVARITNDTTLCPDQEQRNDALLNLRTQCEYWQGYNGTGNCIMGVANEPNNCGFMYDTLGACAYCKENTDTCCKSVSSCTKLTKGAVIGISFGCLVAIAFAGAIFFYLCYRRKLVRKDKFSFNTYVPPPKNIPSTESDPSPAYRAEPESSQNLSAYHDDVQRTSREPVETSPFMTHEELQEEQALAQQQQLALEELYEVVHPYPPQMGDELGLHVADIVCLAMRFDDGWALGVNVTTGLKGVFPVVCIAPASEELLERLLQTSDMADAISEHDYASKTLIEEEEDLGARRTKSTRVPLALNIQQIRDDLQRSVSINSATRRTPLAAPSPLTRSELTDHRTIPRRTASMRASYGYQEAESPTSPSMNTPFFNVSLLTNQIPRQTPQSPHVQETYEMRRQENRVSKHEQDINDPNSSWTPRQVEGQSK